MQFNVPQFETEDKLFGPFTAAQFLYIAITLVISFLLFPLLITWLWLIISIILVGGSFVLALVKIGGRPMPIFLLSAILYLWEPKTFIQSPGLTEIANLAPVYPLSSVKNNDDLIQPTTLPVAPSPITTTHTASVLSSTEIAIDTLTPAILAPSPAIIIFSHSTTKLSPLRDIFNKMMTYSSSIPTRETGLIQSPAKKQGYEFIQKSTGETISARRVDYK